MNQHYLATYEPLCNTLCKVGWFVAPYMTQWEYDELTKICKEIDKEINLDSAKKKQYIFKINNLLSKTVFHPNYRAFFLYRSKEIPYVSDYSHLYERGIYHYYKNDYTSSILTTLPAIEGTLLSYLGWIFGSGQRKPGQKQFIDKFKVETINTAYAEVNTLFSIYGRVIASFLEDWIFSDTSQADLSNSWLNRHILAHGMAPVNINNQIDANRIILFFDLLISYFSLAIQKYYIFIPDDKPQINNRRDYLFNSLITTMPIQKCIEIEESFLSENKNYSKPQILYGLKESIIQSAAKMAELMKLAKRQV